jgi:hypothetical protein
LIAQPPASVDSRVPELLGRYTDQLLAWVDRNGWAGWDPYDLWDSPFGIWAMARESLPQRVAQALIGRVEERFPVAIRRLLGVEPRVNAKAMGLFAAGFLDLEAVEGAPRRLGGAAGSEQCFRWLDDNLVEHGGGVGWGYPFDWRSRLLIPRNTPTVVTSTVIGDAYWLRYRRQDDHDALARCEEICRFILGGLNRSSRRPDGSFCFSYTPVDHFQVHNANLLAAEFLVRIGGETRRDDWVLTGLDAGRFALAELRPDGSLDYWSAEQSGGLQQDLYHSGFEIRMLDRIAEATGREDFREAADRYLETWLERYFTADGVPHRIGDRPDTVEVHSCAEAILCAAQLAGRPALPRDRLPAHLAGSIEAAIRYLWVPVGGAGYFAWISQPRYGTRVRTAIPMIRWGQAWMFRAMAGARLALRAER